MAQDKAKTIEEINVGDIIKFTKGMSGYADDYNEWRVTFAGEHLDFENVRRGTELLFGINWQERLQDPKYEFTVTKSDELKKRSEKSILDRISVSKCNTTEREEKTPSKSRTTHEL